MAKIDDDRRIVAGREVARAAPAARRSPPRPSARNNSSAWSIAITIAGGRSVSSPAMRRASRSPRHVRRAAAAARSRPACVASRSIGAAMCRQDRRERVDQAVLAGQRRALGPDHRQGQELRIVAREPRHQPGAQERGLARARGAEDHQQSRRRAGPQAAQPIDGLDDRRVAAEEDAGVRRLQRLEAAIGRAIRIALRRPGEESWVEPRLLQPALQPQQAVLRVGDVPLLVRAGQLRRKQPLSWPPARSTTCHVPVSSGGRVGDRLRRIDQRRRTASC